MQADPKQTHLRIAGDRLAICAPLVDRPMPPIFHGLLDPKVGKPALDSMLSEFDLGA